MSKVTARKSTGGVPKRRDGDGSLPRSRSTSPIIIESTRSEAERMSNSENFRGRSRSPGHRNATVATSSATVDVSPMELQIRQVELMEEQCDSLEKLVEIAAERRDIEKQLLEVKKRKLALLEKQMENQQ